jgi:acyl-CoA hydrolase
MTLGVRRHRFQSMRIVDESHLETTLAALPILEPRVVASGNFAPPRALLALAERSLERYRLFMLNAQGELPTREEVIFETPFVGPAMRDAGSRLDYLPMRLSLVPRLFATVRPPDVVLLHTSTPKAGFVSLGIEVNILVAAVEQVRARGGIVIAQLNRNMPYTLGDGELREELVDLAFEAEEDLASPTLRPAHEHAETIAQTIAGMVQDGATLQMGIGQIPDATLAALASRRGLAIWSEMISDGVMRLHHDGAIDRSRGIVCSFLFGSNELYGWVDANPQVRLARTETTNDPGRIAAHPAMVSVNTALQVDLFDQAGASHVGGRIYSGFGGQPDFVTGALHSPGGQAIIALRSWHQRSDSSTIVPLLHGPATSFQHSALVSEHGCAQLLGRSQRAQARLIVERVAHPDAQEQLRRAAAAMRREEEGDEESWHAAEHAATHRAGSRARTQSRAGERDFGTIE